MRVGLERVSLHFAVFVSGAVLLGVEIASSRVLPVSPYRNANPYSSTAADRMLSRKYFVAASCVA